MDYLDKLTQLAQVRGEINIRCLFQGDWQVEHQPDAAEYQGLFHLIEQGECWVTFAGKQLKPISFRVLSAKSTALFGQFSTKKRE